MHVDELDRLTKILQNRLNEGELIVSFEKDDGSERTMRCTTMTKLIPENKLPKSKSNNDLVENKNPVLRVFDLDINEWRSFRVSSVHKWKHTPKYE